MVFFWRRIWGFAGLIGLLSGCEQLLINNVNQVSADLAAASEGYERAVAVILTPGLFEVLGERAAQLQLGEWESWAWSGGAVGGFVGGAEVSVGPLDATFKRQSVSVVPSEGGGGIRVTVKYRAPLIAVRLLYRDEAGGTQLCKLDLNLRQRQVVLDLVPGVGAQGQPVWSVGALNGLTGDEPLTYTLTEECSLDVGGFD